MSALAACSWTHCLEWVRNISVRYSKYQYFSDEKVLLILFFPTRIFFRVHLYEFWWVHKKMSLCLSFYMFRFPPRPLIEVYYIFTVINFLSDCSFSLLLLRLFVSSSCSFCFLFAASRSRLTIASSLTTVGSISNDSGCRVTMPRVAISEYASR